MVRVRVRVRVRARVRVKVRVGVRVRVAALSWSKPRRGALRMSTATSQPSARRKPAHSRATYDAPTTSVLPAWGYG